MLSNTRAGANMQLTINSFWLLLRDKFFSNTSMTFSKIHEVSLRAVKIRDISRFSGQVVTLIIAQSNQQC